MLLGTWVVKPINSFWQSGQVQEGSLASGHALLASGYLFNDAAHNWTIRILLTHLLDGPVGHRTSSRLWASHQLWQALGAWAVCLDFYMPLDCPCYFRVSSLVNSTARGTSAGILPCEPHSRGATHSVGSTPPTRRSSRASAALL